MKTTWMKHSIIGLAAIVMVVAFNNCGEGFVAHEFNSVGKIVMFSRAPGETCEDGLMKVYDSTYHGFLNQTCGSCHIVGPGIGTFANPELKASFDSFMSIGSSKINSQATNDAHKPPYTGVANVGRIAEITKSWAGAQADYFLCKSTDGSGGGVGGVVKTKPLPMPTGITGTTFRRVEWDLEALTELGKAPLIAGIEVKYNALNNVNRGYEYRNPTLRLKNAAAGSYNARALNIYVNAELQSAVTTYSNIDFYVTTTTDVNISAGTANALNVRTVAAADTIALEFSSLAPGIAPATPTPSPTPNVGTPTPTPTPIGPVTYAQLAGNGGLFTNNCFGCHNATTTSGGLNLMDYNAAKNAADNIKARVNNAANPMPKGGLLPQNQRDIISAWVDQGAPQ